MTKAALVTGASRGIGLGLAKMLAAEGYALTVASRRPDSLEAAAAELRDAGAEVHAVAANLGDEADIVGLARSHEERFGRLDVLVNSAGVGVGSSIDSFPTKSMDLQIGVNLRGVAILYRECMRLLREAGTKPDGALVVNLASIAGKYGQPWTSMYSATKHAIVGFNDSMNQELAEAGIKSCALCPSYVDTDMTDYKKDQIPAEEMIRVDDLVEVTRMLLRLSRHCIVPEVIMVRPGEGPS